MAPPDETIADMTMLWNALWIAVLALLAILLFAAEILDWIGRIEYIELHWPKVWSAVNNRPMRVVGILIMFVLLAKDVAERLKEPELVVSIAAPPPPIVQQQESRPDPTPGPSARQAPPAAPPATVEPPPAHLGHLTVTEKPDISTRDDLPYRIEVVVQSDIDFPQLKLLTLTCSSPIGLARGGKNGINFAGNSGVNTVDPRKWYLYYQSSTLPFGPANPIGVDIYAAQPISCKQVTTE